MAITNANTTSAVDDRRSAPRGEERSSSVELLVDVGDLVQRPGASRDVRRSPVVEDLRTTTAGVPAGDSVDLDLRVEAITGGVVVGGVISGRWQAECSRCLEPLEEPFALDVHELFEPEPVESETYLLDGDRIDVGPLVRDAVLVSMPVVPLCDDACLGLCPHCGIDRNRASCDCSSEVGDPRWAALDELDFGES